MNCPNCNKPHKGLVNETRQHEGSIYRRRQCTGCTFSYVTVETAPKGLKMPRPVSSGKARGQLHTLPPKVDKPMQADTSALLAALGGWK